MDTKERYRRLTELNVVEQTLNVFKTAVVQRNRVLSSTDASQPYPTPQVHAMIYEPGNGSLKELDVHFDDHFAAFNHMYRLYDRNGQLPLPPTDPSVLHDILESVLLDGARHDKMLVTICTSLLCAECVELQATFNQYANEDSKMDHSQFGQFVQQHVRRDCAPEEVEHAFNLLGGGSSSGVTFLQIAGWWRALEIRAERDN